MQEDVCFASDAGSPPTAACSAPLAGRPARTLGIDRRDRLGQGGPPDHKHADQMHAFYAGRRELAGLSVDWRGAAFAIWSRRGGDLAADGEGPADDCLVARVEGLETDRPLAQCRRRPT